MVWRDLGLNPGLPDNWRTLYPLGQWAGCQVKLATLVEGDTKVPFSIATTAWSREGWFSFPLIALFTLELYLIMLSVKQGGIKYHFLSLWYDSTWDWTPVCRAIGEPFGQWTGEIYNINLINMTEISAKQKSDPTPIDFRALSTSLNSLSFMNNNPNRTEATGSANIVVMKVVVY